VIGPNGRRDVQAPLYDEGLFFVDVDLADIRRERIGLPLLRDERPELRELRADRARAPGMAGSSPSRGPGGEDAMAARPGGAPR
jgi:hypothetical protein